MTVLRLVDDFRMFPVAAPNCLARREKPSLPRDLHARNCIRYRLPSDSSIQPWIFRKSQQEAEIAVEGSLTVNDLDLQMSDGVGIAYVAEAMAAPSLAQG